MRRFAIIALSILAGLVLLLFVFTNIGAHLINDDRLRLADRASCTNQLKVAREALEHYRKENGSYPPSLNTLKPEDMLSCSCPGTKTPYTYSPNAVQYLLTDGAPHTALRHGRKTRLGITLDGRVEEIPVQ